MTGGEWIEQIRVRSTAPALEAALPTLQQQVAEIDASHAATKSFVVQHALYEGDLAVVMVWPADTPPAKTREGLLVAEQLERLGSVDHAVWVPAEK